MDSRDPLPVLTHVPPPPPPLPLRATPEEVAAYTEARRAHPLYCGGARMRASTAAAAAARVGGSAGCGGVG